MEVIPPQAAVEEEPQIYTGSGTQYIDESKFNFMRWQLDTDELLEDFEYTLKGYKKERQEDGGLKWVERVEGKQLMNGIGISRIMTVLCTRITRLSMMSDLDEEKITLFASDCANSVNDLLYEEGDTFEMQDSDWCIITGLIFDHIYITLRRSYKGGERRFISLVERTIEQFMTRNDSNPKKDIMGMINPFSKK